MIDDAVRGILAGIYDPCSVAAGRPQSIVDMGLVLGWRLTGGTLSIDFCVTFPGCTMAPHFVEAARERLLGLNSVHTVVTRVDTAHVWTPPALRAMHGEPQAWRRRQHAA